MQSDVVLQNKGKKGDWYFQCLFDYNTPGKQKSINTLFKYKKFSLKSLVNRHLARDKVDELLEHAGFKLLCLDWSTRGSEGNKT